MKVADLSYRSLSILTLGIVIGVIAGGWFVTAYFGFIRAVFQSFSDVTAFVSAGATVVLVIVTAAYVVLTWQLVSETRDARQQEVMPVINLELESHMMGALSPMIRNIGNGPAIDVEGTVRLEPDGDEHDIGSKNIAPGDFALSLYPAVGDDTSEEYDKLCVDGHYIDVFGRRVPFNDDIELKDLSKLNEVEPITHEEQELKYLKQIDDSLETIAEEMDWFELQTKLESREKIIDVLRKHGSLTVQELSEETGIRSSELGALMTFLKGAGAVDYESKRDNEFADKDVEITLTSSK